MTHEITKMLVLSTGHLTEDTCNRHLTEVGYDKPDAGAFVYVGTGEFRSGEEPEDLIACEDLAIKLGCGWIMFDSDGPIEAGLPLYDW